MPTLVAAKLEGRAAREQAVEGEYHRQPRGQAVKGLQLAILLGGMGGRVPSELAQQREGEAVGGDQFGLQPVVVVARVRPWAQWR